MNIPGFRLHPVKGGMAGRWSVTVNGNWREPFGPSGRELAKQLDVAASTLSRVLSGASRVTPEMALRLSKALGRSDLRHFEVQ